MLGSPVQSQSRRSPPDCQEPGLCLEVQYNPNPEGAHRTVKGQDYAWKLGTIAILMERRRTVKYAWKSSTLSILKERRRTVGTMSALTVAIRH